MVRRKNRRKPIAKRHIKISPCFDKTRSRFGTHYHYEERSLLMEKDSLNSRVNSKILLLLGFVSHSLSLPISFVSQYFQARTFERFRTTASTTSAHSIKFSAGTTSTTTTTKGKTITKYYQEQTTKCRHRHRSFAHCCSSL